MENREHEVWQRVLGQQSEQPRDDLRGMLLAAMELAEIYRHLMGRSSGLQRERLRQLQEGESASVAMLRGLGLLTGLTEEVLRPWNPTREPVRQLLERSYHKTRRCMVDYMSRAAEPEFGVVFRALADRAANHCSQIAWLLGIWK